MGEKERVKLCDLSLILSHSRSFLNRRCRPDSLQTGCEGQHDSNGHNQSYERREKMKETRGIVVGEGTTREI